MVAFDATWNCRLRESGGESREASQATGHEDVARGEGERRRGEASYGVPGPVRATTTTRGMRDRKGVRGTRRKSDRERERERWCGHRGEERRIRGKKRKREREGEDQPPLLACRGLMNANHDPEAARSTCCFPVQIAYNFYCHGRNSSLMEAPAYLAPRFASRQTVFHAFCCPLLFTLLPSISTFSPPPPSLNLPSW